MLKYALLGFLDYGDKSGYDIKREMDISTNHFWHARISQIYSTLKKLEAGNLVASRIEEQTSKPNRRVYHLTDDGRTILLNWLNTPHTEIDPRKETLLLRMFFSAKADKEKLLEQLCALEVLHRDRAKYYREFTAQRIREAERRHPELKRDAFLWELNRKFGERFEEMYADWLSEVNDEVEKNY